MQRVGVDDMPATTTQQVQNTRRNSQTQSLKNLAFYNNTTSRKRNIEREEKSQDIKVIKVDNQDRIKTQITTNLFDKAIKVQITLVQFKDWNTNINKSSMQEGRKTGRHYENRKETIEPPSIMSDDQNTQVIMGTINTDVFSESRRHQRNRQSYKGNNSTNFDITIQKTKYQFENTNLKSTKMNNDLQHSIRSSKSQHAFHIGNKSQMQKQYQQEKDIDKKSTVYKKSERNYESYKVSSIEDNESHQKEERLLSPNLKSNMMIKNAKSDFKKNTGINKRSFKQDNEVYVEESPQVAQSGHKRKISNFNVQKIHLSQLASPINLKDKPMTARPKGLIHGEIRVQKQYPKQDTDNERSGDETYRARGSKTRKADSRYDLEETKQFSNSKKIFSMIVSDKLIQNNANQQNQYTSNKSPLGPKLVRRMGDRFGLMFKLQKKNLNDEGIQGVDEGNFNNSQEMRFGVGKQVDDSMETPMDSQSDKISNDELLNEYQELKQKLSNIKPLDKQSSRKQQIDLHQNRDKSQRGRKSFIKDQQSSGKGRKSAKRQKGKKSRGSKYSNSRSDQDFDRRDLLSYDDNSFERELIDKLNQESSIHEDIEKSKSYYDQRRGKSQYQKGYVSKNQQSKTSFYNHKRQKSNKMKQLSQSSNEQSCSTCRNRQNSSIERSYNENDGKNKRKTNQKQRQKSVGRDKSRKRQQQNKQKNNQNQQQQFINQFQMQMPLMTMLTPQFSMFGFPMPQVPTTQIMNFQNNFSYQGSQFPMFMPQQQQYLNMTQQAPYPQFYQQNQNDTSQMQQAKTPQRNSEEKLKETYKDITSPNSNQEKKNSRKNNENQQSNNSYQSPLHTTIINSNQDLLGTQQDQSHLKPSHIKNQLSNQTLDSIENNASKIDKSTLPLQQKQTQKSKFAEDNSKMNQQRLGSPQSNISRLDAQSTNMTGDYQSSVAPSQLAMINFNNRRSLNIQSQIKEVNQLYLNKLKDKFSQQTPNNISSNIPKIQDIHNQNQHNSDNIMSPTLNSRNSLGLNQAKSIPLQDQQNEQKIEKVNYQIQPNVSYVNKLSQSSTFRNSYVVNNQQQRQSSQPPEIYPVKLKNYESQNQNTISQKDELSIQKIERHRSPQPSEMRMFNNGNQTNERLSAHRYSEVEQNIKTQDYNDNYYFNKNEQVPIKKNPNDNYQIPQNDIQSKLKMLNAKLAQARQESNNSRQIKDIRFVELLSNNDDNDDHSPYEMGQHSQHELIRQSRQDTYSQPPEFKRVSYQPQKQSESQNQSVQQSLVKQNTSISSTIAFKKQIKPHQKQQYIDLGKDDSEDIIQTENISQSKSSKIGMIVIDNSPKSINTNNHPKNKVKQKLTSPKHQINNNFAMRSDYTGAESMRSSIYFMDEESKTFANSSFKQSPMKISQQRQIKQQPKKRPSNTTKQSGFIEDFNSGVKQGQKNTLNSSNNNLVTMTYDDKNNFQNNSLSTHRLTSNNKFDVQSQQKGSQSNKHSIISKQLTMNNTQIIYDKNQRVLSDQSEKEVFIEIFDKPKKNLQQQQQQVRTTDNRGKSQINNIQSDNVSDTNSNLSLADMFKQKMRQKSIPPVIEKKLVQGTTSAQMATIQEREVKPEPKQEKERTKQDILELRKKMMKSTVKEKKDNFAVEPPRDANGKIKEMPIELMQRLSKGQKVQVDSKEAIKLSHKNYENLPEIKKKKEEERKKEDYKQRQLMVKKYAEELDKKRKQLQVKKQASNNEKYNDVL